MRQGEDAWRVRWLLVQFAPSILFRNCFNRKLCEDINDSKQIKEEKREELFDIICKLGDKNELFWAFGSASVEEIESENIVGATCLAMKRAMEQVSLRSNGIWQPTTKKRMVYLKKTQNQVIHGLSAWMRPMKRLPFHHEGIIKGDTFSLAIAMGSLVAKVTERPGNERIIKTFSNVRFFIK